MPQNREGDVGRAEEEGEVEEEDAAILHFQRYSESRAALPWSERTLREKISYYLDRIFLVFLGVVLVILLAEAAYKTWYVTNLKAIYSFVKEIVTYFLTQEEKEELIEL